MDRDTLHEAGVLSRMVSACGYKLSSSRLRRNALATGHKSRYEDTHSSRAATASAPDEALNRLSSAGPIEVEVSWEPAEQVVEQLVGYRSRRIGVHGTRDMQQQYGQQMRHDKRRDHEHTDAQRL